MLLGSVHIIKESEEALILAIQKTGIEINADRSQ
jgi:hypothetical protein